MLLSRFRHEKKGPNQGITVRCPILGISCKKLLARPIPFWVWCPTPSATPSPPSGSLLYYRTSLLPPTGGALELHVTKKNFRRGLRNPSSSVRYNGSVHEYLAESLRARLAPLTVMTLSQLSQGYPFSLFARYKVNMGKLANVLRRASLLKGKVCAAIN